MISLLLLILTKAQEEYQHNYWSAIQIYQIQSLSQILKQANNNETWLESYTYLQNKIQSEDYRYNQISLLNYEIMKLNYGYNTRPSRNTEILIYIVSGTILYKDSRGRIQKLYEQNIMYLSAGFGIYHSEFCVGSTNCEYITIKTEPRRINFEPSFHIYQFSIVYNTWNNLVGDINDLQSRSPIKIDSSMIVSVAQFDKLIDYYLPDAFQVYIICLQGFVEFNEKNVLKKGDGAKIKGPILLQFFPEIESQLLLIKMAKII